MSGRLPPLNPLRAFEATARHGSVTAAARELNVTHGAISHQIKALEAILECANCSSVAQMAQTHAPRRVALADRIKGL